MLTSTSLANINECSLSRISCHLHSGFSYDRNFFFIALFQKQKVLKQVFFCSLSFGKKLHFH